MCILLCILVTACISCRVLVTMYTSYCMSSLPIHYTTPQHVL